MARNPFEDLEELFDRMEAQFESSGPLGVSSTAVDVIELDDAYVVKAELPGFGPEDLTLRYADGRLYIDAEREDVVEETEEARFVRHERSTTVDRTVKLPDGVDADGIDAEFEDGVLTVDLPTLDPDDGGKHIEIE